MFQARCFIDIGRCTVTHYNINFTNDDDDEEEDDYDDDDDNDGLYCVAGSVNHKRGLVEGTAFNGHKGTSL